MNSLTLYLKYNTLLFWRTHGYTYALVMMLYGSIVFLKKSPLDEVKIWILIGILEMMVTLSLMTFGSNLLGSERAFWSIRILSKTPTISVIYERLTALMVLKVMMSFIYIFLYSAAKRMPIPMDFYLCILLLSVSVLPWVTVWSSILNPMPFKSYLFSTDMQTTSAVKMLRLLIMFAVIMLVYVGQIWLRYVLKESVELWILGSVALSIILLGLFWTVGVRLFSNMLYKHRFRIAQNLRPTT